MSQTIKGYNSDFLGVKLPLPKLPSNFCASLKTGKGKEIKYVHYSSFLHSARKFPFMTAVNIKGEEYNANSRTGNEPWDYSDQVAEELQLDNAFYSNDGNTFDRGHLVRRVDPCWGTEQEAEEADLSTFKWTNCTPQHKSLNQKGGVWYELEQFVMENGVKNKIANVSVFAGPVLNNNDKVFKVLKGKYKGTYIQIPVEFWKVIVWKKTNGKLYAVGFLMSQWEFIKNAVTDIPQPEKIKKSHAPKPSLADDYFETLKFKDHKTYQVPLDVIQKKTGIKFSWGNVMLPYRSPKPRVIEAVPAADKKRSGSLPPEISEKIKKAAARKTIPKSRIPSSAIHKNDVSKPYKKYKLVNVQL